MLSLTGLRPVKTACLTYLLLSFSTVPVRVGHKESKKENLRNATPVLLAMAATPQVSNGENRELGKSYDALRPEQKRLVDDLFAITTPPPEASLFPNRPTTMLDYPYAPRSTP